MKRVVEYGLLDENGNYVYAEQISDDFVMLFGVEVQDATTWYTMEEAKKRGQQIIDCKNMGQTYPFDYHLVDAGLPVSVVEITKEIEVKNLNVEFIEFNED